MPEFIHIQLLHIELGPYSERQVREALAAGHLQPSDSARYEPNKEWQPLSEVLATLPKPILAVPPLLNAKVPSGPVSPATVFIAPTPPQPIVIASPVAELVPATLQPIVVLVAPQFMTVAPPVAEYVPDTLQPVVVLFSPLLPARQLLPSPHIEATAAPPLALTPAEDVPAKVPSPAPQLLEMPQPLVSRETSKMETPVESPTDSSLKEREITPPPKPVVPYNQPIPRPGRTPHEHWKAWGKYAAAILILILLIIWSSWKMMEPTMAYFWAEVNFALIQLLDNIIAVFTVRPVR